MEKLNIKSGKQIADRIREALDGVIPAETMRFYGAENYETGEIKFCMSILDFEGKYKRNSLKESSGPRLANKIRKALAGMVPSDEIKFEDEFARGKLRFHMWFLVPSMELLRGEERPQGGVPASEVPGVVVKEGKPYKEAGGCLLPVGGVLRCNGGACIPVLDVKQMDERPSKAQEAGQIGGK